MTWSAASDRMRRELKTKVVPELRARGFRGSFPHFARHSPTRIDLLTFQFSQWSPGLYVEIATVPPEGLTLASGSTIPPDKVRVHHTAHRYRLGSTQRDHLFTFDPDTHGPEVFDQVTNTIITSLKTEADPWWQEAAPPRSARLPDN